MSRNTDPALDVLADVRLGAHARSLPVGAATLAVDGLGRQVLSIQLAVLPSDGRCYLSLQEVLTLARDQEEATHA